MRSCCRDCHTDPWHPWVPSLTSQLLRSRCRSLTWLLYASPCSMALEKTPKPPISMGNMGSAPCSPIQLPCKAPGDSTRTKSTPNPPPWQAPIPIPDLTASGGSLVPAMETCLSARAWLKNCLMSGGTAFAFLEGKGTKWYHFTITNHLPAPLCDLGLTGASMCFWRGPGGPGWRSILGPVPQRAVGWGEEKHHSARAHNPKMDQKGKGAEPHGSGFGLTVSREQSVAARLRCVSEAQRPRRLCKLCRRKGSAPRPGPRYPPHEPQQRPGCPLAPGGISHPGSAAPCSRWCPPQPSCRGSPRGPGAGARSRWLRWLRAPGTACSSLHGGGRDGLWAAARRILQHGTAGGPVAPPGAQLGRTFSSKHRPGQVEALQALGSLLKVPAEGDYPW